MNNLQQFSQELEEKTAKIRSLKDEEIKEKGFDPLAYRLFLMENLDKENIDFTWEKLWQSQMRLWGMRKEAAKFYSLYQKVSATVDMCDYSNSNLNEKISEFMSLLNNNLNFSTFLELYNSYLLETNKNLQNWPKDKVFFREIRHIFFDLDSQILNLNLLPQMQISCLNKIFQEVLLLSITRQEVKLTKNWAKADEIRSQIQKLGWQIDDYAWGFGVWWRGN